MKSISIKTCILFLMVLILFLAMFYPLVFKGEAFTFRDEAYFYNPMFSYIQDYWNRGELPLWDPCDNLGQPLAAVPTSTVFYPMKVLFFLPALTPVSYQFCYKWYILSHFLIGFVAVYTLIRHWKISRGGAVLGATSYVFGGGVLFQYCNPIFLIGAVWLPFAFYFADRLIRERSCRMFFSLALVLTMMVLGGDPQMAYMSGFPIIALCLFYWRHERKRQKQQRENCNHITMARPVSLCYLLLLLGGSALFAALLSAVQIIPTMDVTKKSDRNHIDYPLSLWDIPEYLKNRENKDRQTIEDYYLRLNPNMTSIGNTFYRRHNNQQTRNRTTETESVKEQHETDSSMTDIWNGIFCQTLYREDSSYSQYNFSMGPWLYAGLFWPNIGGNWFPENTRWFDATPNDYPWTFSIYLGLIPCLLGCTVMRFRSTHHFFQPIDSRSGTHHLIRSWASWLIILAALATLGGYGIGWWFRCLSSLIFPEINLKFNNGDPLGGLYWFMTVMIPKFSSFRYPAKLFPMVALGLAILAGIGWDSVRRHRTMFHWIQTIGVFTLIATAFFLWQGEDFFYFASIKSGTIFGNYDAGKAYTNTLITMAQTGLVLVLYTLIFKNGKLNPFTRKGKRGKFAPTRAFTASLLVLSITCVDLYYMNSRIVSTGPEQVFSKSGPYHKIIKETQPQMGQLDMPPMRTHRFSTWFPNIFNYSSSYERMTERVLWERWTFATKYHYQNNMASLESRGTLMINSYAAFIEWFNKAARSPSSTDILDYLDCSWQICPGNMKQESKKVELVPSRQARESGAAFFPIDSELWHSVRPSTGRARIYHNTPELDNPRMTILDMLQKNLWGNPNQGEYAKITHFSANRLTLDIVLTEPGDIVLSEQYDNDWFATCYQVNQSNDSGTPLAIQPTLQFMRRISLDAGHYRVVMEYRPKAFYQGLAVSVFAWFTIPVILLMVRFRRNKSYRG